MQVDIFIAKHMKRVEALSDGLKTVCLGQDISLYDILEDLPTHNSDEWAANHLADRISFCLAEMQPTASAEEIQRARDWLFGIIFFLRRECTDADFTFKSIKRLMHLPYETRHALFRKNIECYRILRVETSVPPLLKQYDEAVLRLLDACGLVGGVLARYNHVSSLLGDLPAN